MIAVGSVVTVRLFGRRRLARVISHQPNGRHEIQIQGTLALGTVVVSRELLTPCVCEDTHADYDKGLAPADDWCHGPRQGDTTT